jgi:hypothetical protein
MRCGKERSAGDIDAGWSSPVARQAHNLKVAGSNPAPATNQAPSGLWTWRRFAFAVIVAREARSEARLVRAGHLEVA